MATGSTEFIDTTTAANAIPELWSRATQDQREDNLLLARLFDRQFEKEMSHGDILHVLNISNMAARTKSANTAITYETATETLTDITVSTHEYAAIAIETIAKKQQAIDLIKKYTPKMGHALAHSVDDVLAGRFDDFSNTVGTLGTPTSYSDWLRADQYLNDAMAPGRDRFIYIGPAEKKNLGEMQQFVGRDYSKVNDDTAFKNGDRLGTWLGYPVYMSSNCEGTNAAGHDCGMAHKEAIALVIQVDMPSYHFFDIDYLADKHAVEQLYGVAEMRDDHGVFVKAA